MMQEQTTGGMGLHLKQDEVTPASNTATGASGQYGAPYGMDEPFVVGKSTPVNGQGRAAGPEAVMSVPADRGKLFAILGAITAVTILCFVLIFALGKGGKKGASSKEEVAKIFIEAMDSRDEKKTLSLCPPFLRADKDDIKSSFNLLDSYGLHFRYIGPVEFHDYDSTELSQLESRIKSADGVNASLEAACDVTYKYEATASYGGMTESEESENTLTAVKCKGRWYLYE